MVALGPSAQTPENTTTWVIPTRSKKIFGRTGLIPGIADGEQKCGFDEIPRRVRCSVSRLRAERLPTASLALPAICRARRLDIWPAVQRDVGAHVDRPSARRRASDASRARPVRRLREEARAPRGDPEFSLPAWFSSNSKMGDERSG